MMMVLRRIVSARWFNEEPQGHSRGWRGRRVPGLLMIGCLAVSAVGCGSGTPGVADDAGAPRDALVERTDAGLTAPAPRAARDVLPAGGRISGGAFIMDVTVGHGIKQTRTSNQGTSLEGNTAVKP